MGSGLALAAFATKVKPLMKAEKERRIQEGGKIWGGGERRGGHKWYNLHGRLLSMEQRKKRKGKMEGDDREKLDVGWQ